MKNKAILAGILALCLAFTLVSAAQAEKYPTKPIKLVIPWSPGGGSDIAGRTLAARVSPLLGQDMVVVNVTGGGGTVAGREVMNSKPDGYTLFFPHTSLQTSFYTGTADFNYEAFKPICRLVALNQAFLIRASEKYKNLKEFIAYVRKNPGKVKAGCVIGSLSHYAILGLEEAANVKFRIVPQQGEAKRIVALKGKHIDFSPFTLTSVNKYIGSGDFRAIGVAAEERDPTMKNIPTCKEQGFDVLAAYNYYLFAPKGISQDKVTLLDKTFGKMLADPKIAAALSKINVIPAYLPESKVLKALAVEGEYLKGIAERKKLDKRKK